MAAILFFLQLHLTAVVVAVVTEKTALLVVLGVEARGILLEDLGLE
jgi:hypothetical protein